MRNVLLIFLLALSTSGKAQTHRFSYDASGNMVYRTTVSHILHSNSLTKKIEDSDESLLSSTNRYENQDLLLDGETLTVFNPKNSNRFFSIFTLDGQVICARQQIQQSNHKVDVSNIPSKAIIVSIQDENETEKTYKLTIKQ